MKVKHIIAAALLAAMPIQAASVKVTHGDNNTNSIDLSKQARYIVLPVEKGAPNARFEVTCDASGITSGVDIPLAVNKIDHYVTINIEHAKTGEAALKLNNASKDAIGWKSITLTNEYDPDKDEQYRPIYHHSPFHGWMNDPNGMFYKDGRYHLYYQYNPWATTWGNMHWAHASSSDLVHWKNEGIAIPPDALGAVFSGSSIVDHNNAAGYGKGAIIAFYTSAGSSQTQSMAYSTDNGRTFTKYEKNPVVTGTNPDFRDPKVIFHKESGKFIMVLSVAKKMEFYSSSNLKDWKLESDFGVGWGQQSGCWECPDLVQLADETGKKKWVLLVNINGGAPSNGSGTQYFIGDFDGKTFTCEDEQQVQKWQDYGKDHYATVCWDNAPDGRTVAIGWMNNWEYANSLPTEAFRSANTIARDLYLFDYKGDTFLGSRPSPEIEKFRTPSKELTAACEVNFKLKAQDDPQVFTLENKEGEGVVFTVDFKANTIAIDRSKSGKVTFSGGANNQIVAPILGDGYDVRIFIDKGSVECFINDGKTVLSNAVFPSSTYTELKFSDKKNATKPKIYSIK